MICRFSNAALTGICIAWGAVCAGCGADDRGSSPTPQVTADIFDAPVRGISRALTERFNDGDIAFDTPLRAADGLGPLYTRSSCDACHADALRGPGAVQKMSFVEADGVTPKGDQSALLWGHTVHPLGFPTSATPILPPQDPAIKISLRAGPPVLGRGYMEAVADAEIERIAAEQAAAGGAARGRVNHVRYASEIGDPGYNPHQKGDLVIGRFGLKARIATLDEFTADAFQGDMGITTPYRPTEFANPDGLTDDAKPGVDVGFESVDVRAMYLRLLSIPARRVSEAGGVGQRLFADNGCATCHVPSLRTRADYPIAQLADIDAAVYTDFLLHDMGSELADGLPEAADVDGEAGSFDWRTSPLIGLRFNRNFLHDGRAESIEHAILLHRGPGSEANESVDHFEALSDADRTRLLDFVESL
jgi:CxxC motif-containing protein (DUF1111 family)